MHQWQLDEKYIQYKDLGDSLREELRDLVNVRLYNFDAVVKDMSPGDTPKSVDSLAITDDCVYFIEFKRMSGDDAILKQIKESIKLKSVESLHLCENFLKDLVDGRKLTLIIVSQDSRSDVTEGLTLPDDSPYCPDYIKRYMHRDCFENRMFFDDVFQMNASRFVRFANENLACLSNM